MDALTDVLKAAANRGIKLAAQDGQLQCYAQKGTLTEELRADIKRYKPEILALLARQVAPEYQQPLKYKWDAFPLGANQQQACRAISIKGREASGCFVRCIRLASRLQLADLRRACSETLTRHPLLTARLAPTESPQYHFADSGMGLVPEEITAEEAGGMQWPEVLEELSKQPLDALHGPLIKVRYMSDASAVFVIGHPIICDAQSLDLIATSLLNAYLGQTSGPRQDGAPAPGYMHFALAETQYLSSPRAATDAAFWCQHLRGELPISGILPDRSRSAERAPVYASATRELSPDLSRELRRFSHAYGIPLQAMMLAIFYLQLHRYTGQEAILVAVSESLRKEGSYSQEVGDFMNELPLLVRCDPQERLRDLLRKVQVVVHDASYHRRYPASLMHDEAENAIAPKVQYSFTERGPEVLSEATRFQIFDFDAKAEAFDLTYAVQDSKEQIRIKLTVDANLYEQASAEGFLDHSLVLLTNIPGHLDLSLGLCPLLAPGEQDQLLHLSNGTKGAVSNQCLHELFIEQARKQPNVTAVEWEGQEISYGELLKRSGQIAVFLRSKGVRREGLVGLCAERSFDMLVGLLGILSAGAAYVPLDPKYPAERLAYMMEDSGLSFILTQAGLVDMLCGLMPPTTKLAVIGDVIGEAQRGGRVETGTSCSPNQDAQPENLAYVIYTSGSTGNPKGVAIEHRSAVSLVLWAGNVFSSAELKGVLASTSICFDLSIFELFVPLIHGGTVILAENVLGLPRSPNCPITLINTVPSSMDELLRSGIVPDSVLTINLAGEFLPAALVDRIYHNTNAKKVYDLYGPSEDTTYSTIALRRASTSATIGRPISGTRTYILDENAGLQPVGVAGELHLSGSGLARGYLHREDLTQARFVANPFEEGRRMYRTGDLVRWLPDGSIQYLGRLDTQVKVRGFRIELGEIEARLLQYPGIVEGAVIATGHLTDARLVAFYQVSGNTIEQLLRVDEDDLYRHLKAVLPEYMVPSSFVSLPALPRTASGKFDRKALAKIDDRVSVPGEYKAPSNDFELHVVTIWADVLKLPPEKISMHDDFFRKGGNSLLAARVAVKVRSQLGLEVPLRAIFTYKTISALAKFLYKADRSEYPILMPTPREIGVKLPLSYVQERLWFLNQLAPESPAYHVPIAVTLRGTLQVRALERALDLVIARHEALRTVFDQEAGRPWQKVQAEGFCSIDVIDVPCTPSDPKGRKAIERICREDTAPFSLRTGPLLRSKLLRLNGEEHVLLLNMHHIISDGWSLGILIGEVQTILAAAGEGTRPQLPELSVQYLDWVLWQRNLPEAEEQIESHLVYWRGKLGGGVEVLELPADFSRPSVPSYVGRRHFFEVSRELFEGLRDVGERWGGTLFMVLLGVFKVLLHRYTGQTDICVGTPIANRQQEKLEGLIGMFVNTLALRDEVRGEESFRSLFERIRSTCLEAYEHQDAPFERVVDAVQPERNLAVSPLFQAVLVVQNVGWERSQEGPGVEPYPLDLGVSKFDVSLEFTEGQAGLRGSLEYSTALFDPERMERMAEHFVGLCRAVVARPEQAIGDLEYLEAGERRQLVEGFNQTAAWYPEDRCIHELIAVQVAERPEQTALVYADQQLSYGELAGRSGQLAQCLQGWGIGPDSIVGLCLERSLEMVVGILGIVEAGGAYLPLDPEYPDERLAYMADDSRCAVVLTQESLAGRVRALVPAGTRVLSLDTEWREVLAGSVAGATPAPGVRPEHLCYVIYTSGSTGRPKGVLVEHRALVNRIHWMQRRYELEAGDTVLQKTPYSFDVSVWEFFWPLMAGARLVLAAPGGHRDVAYLGSMLTAQQITVLHFVPSMLQIFLEHAPSSYAGVRHVFASGEALGWHTVQGFRKKFPRARLHNLYGPTEAAIDVSFCECSGLREGVVPIGQPIDNLALYVLDGRRQVVPVGVAGELHIAGVGLARGYLQRPELTAERFVANPFQSGSRMYRTGDRARWLPDGNIQYLGRLDTQVKVQGFRIELGEIEARLNQHPGVEESIVVTQGDGEGRLLVGFYRAAPGLTPEDEDLRTHLKTTLPAYMVPALLVRLETLPLSSNGKADRKALAALELQSARRPDASNTTAPRDAVEQQMVAVWAELLQRDPATIGIHDSFFQLGGHSLLATRLLAKIRTRMQIELSLKIIFERNTVAGLAEVIRRASSDQAPALVPVDRTRWPRLPLSFAQERLWFLDQMEPGTAGYNLPTAVRLRGDLPAKTLEQTFRLILSRHEALRTVFPSENGQPFQHILQDPGFVLECTDLRPLATPQERDQAARALCQKEAATPFDLAQGPLLRAKLLRLNDQEHVLLLNMHHIVSDGWSYGILLHELQTIFYALQQHKSPTLPTLPIQYADFTLWQRNSFGMGKQIESHLVYWRGKLGGGVEVLELPADFSRPSVPSYVGRRHFFEVSRELFEGLRDVGERWGGTLFMVLLGVFKVLLHRYTGQTDICVGTPIANRQQEKLEGLIGMFVNTLALRDEVRGEESFRSLFERIRSTCLEAYEHQDAPFERVVDAVQPERNLAVSPLFQAVLVVQNVGWERSQEGPGVEPYPLDLGVSKFDVSLEFTEGQAGLRGSLEYSTALFDPERMERMAEHFVGLCRAVVARPEQAIGDLEYLEAGERRQLVEGFNQTAAWYPEDRCIHELIAVQVAERPEQTALVYADQQLSYGELAGRSGQLAQCLQGWGIGPDSIVGLCLERSLEMVVGILGIVEAGGAYLPLDPEYPDERLAYMADDSRCAVVLTQESLAGRVRALVPAGTRVLSLDTEWREVLAGSVAGATPAPGVRPEHLCYVIYTSGSTGRPKGVLVEHRALVNRIHWMQRRYELEAGDTVLQKTPYSFDVSVWEFFWPLMAGARLVLAAPGGHRDVAYLGSMLTAQQITVLHFVPSMLQIFLEHAPSSYAGVRHVFASGEALGWHTVQGFRKKFPRARLHNLYGPTEAAIDVSFCECSGLREGVVPIGQPIDNLALYVLDGRRQVVPVGVAGELHIAGVGLARGYLQRPELTAERFVANPFQSGSRMYRTGDRARWLPDGNIQYLGRLDTQVKVQGFRIELGEIEARLNQHPGVEESIVVTQGDGEGRLLVGFYRAAPGLTPEDEDLRTHLKTTLPAYMVPALLVRLETLPLSSNGKADRKALAALELQSARRPDASNTTAPRDAVEQQMVAVWAELLQRDPATIGIHDSFFQLGGHSLLATRLLAKIRTRMQIELSLKIIFERNTVAGLAEVIRRASSDQAPALVPVDRTRWPRLPLSFAQERLWFLDQMEPGTAGYNLPTAVRLRGDLPAKTLEQTFRLILSRHEALRTVFPSENGQPFQHILQDPGFVLECTDLRPLATPQERDQAARALCQKEAATPFDLAQGPLLRAKLLRLNDQEHVLLLNMHHIVSDGWSYGILLHELQTIFYALQQHKSPTLPTLPIQYADFTLWQRNSFENSDLLEQQIEFWKGTLADVPENVTLTPDFARPAFQSFAGDTYEQLWAQSLTSKLTAVGERYEATLFMVLLAAFKVLVFRYTGKEDFCIGTAVANRQHEEVEGLIGMFVNMLALRDRIDPKQSFGTFLLAVKTTCVQAYAHQDAPFERVVEQVGPCRDPSVTPLFQLTLTLQTKESEPQYGDLMQPLPVERSTSKFDLGFDFAQTDEGLAMTVEYCTSLYSRETVTRIAEHLLNLCNAIALNPEIALEDYAFSGEEERRRLLEQDSHTDDYPREATLHELFSAQVQRTPGRIAIEDESESLSYKQLDLRSNQLAHYLTELGVATGDRVALHASRSASMMVALLSVLKCGASYLPIDPSTPDGRLRFVVEDAGAKLLLHDGASLEHLARGRIRVIDLAAAASAVSSYPNTAVENPAQTDDIAYVIYTSGSTGTPKGVLIEHRSVVNYVTSAVRYYGVSEKDRVLQFSSLSFDAAAEEIFPTWLCGATLVLRPNDLLDSIEGMVVRLDALQISLLSLPTAVWHAWVTGMTEKPLTMPQSLRAVIIGGECVKPERIAQWQHLVGRSVRLLNTYGPTETTIVATAADLTKGGSEKMLPLAASIGKPLSNVQVYILDRKLRLQPLDVPGELCIAGDGLARGYLNRPELTAERFVPHPFRPGQLMYRTGDLARRRSDGNVQFLGRIDTQVKIRGFRIELGEIEARLSQHPNIQESVVLIRGMQEQEELIAFFVGRRSLDDQALATTPEELRKHLTRSLPDYMIPTAFVNLQAFPLTHSGKVDRRKLAAMEVQRLVKPGRVAPTSEMEIKMAAIWAEVLGLSPKQLGVTDSFFELGGHSLSAVRLMAKINQHFGELLPLAAIFSAPDIATMTQLISGAQRHCEQTLVVLQQGGAEHPVFAIPGAGGNVLSLKGLSNAFGRERLIYGLQAVGLDGREPPLRTVEDTARVNISAMRTVQPSGPYTLVGHSYGGVVAYAMSQQLLKGGEQIACLTLLDSIAPAVMQEELGLSEREDLLQACSGLAEILGVEIGPSVIDSLQQTDDETLVEVLRAHNVEIDAAQFVNLVSVYRANAQAYRAYRPTPLRKQIDVRLFVADMEQDPARRRLPDDLGWGALLGDSLDIVKVNANHYSILSAPDVGLSTAL